MLRKRRLELIVGELEKSHSVSSIDLMKKFNVSEGTIRRDLNELEKSGLLRKVHGGAIPKSSAPSKYDRRIQLASERKTKLAKKTLPLLLEDQVIIIDGGSTSNSHLSSQLNTAFRATIFTNSLPIADSLLEHKNIDLHLMGGCVHQDLQSTVGPELMRSLSNIRADLCIIGVRSLHYEIGLTDVIYDTIEYRRIMIQQSDQVWALVTNHKFNTADSYRICGIDELDTIVVEDDVDPEFLSPYKNVGIKIV